MFWVRIRPGGREYLGVLDAGATISIVAKKNLPPGDPKNVMPTAAIRMGDGHVVHSCGDCEIDLPMGSRNIAHRFYVMDTEAFDFVLGTDFFVEHSQILSLTLQAPYVLHVDHGDGRESVPLEQSEHTSSYLRVCKKDTNCGRPSSLSWTSARVGPANLGISGTGVFTRPCSSPTVLTVCSMWTTRRPGSLGATILPSW